MPWWKWLDKLDTTITDENMFNWFCWSYNKVVKLFSEHYLMAPLATIGILTIGFILYKLWKENSKINQRILKFEKKLEEDEKSGV